MEDILASIRRIIADDQDGPTPAALVPAHAADPRDPPREDDGAAEEEVLDLAEIAEPASAVHAAEDDFTPADLDLDAFARALPEPEGEPFDPVAVVGDESGAAGPGQVGALHLRNAGGEHAEPAPVMPHPVRSEPAPAPVTPAQATQAQPARPQAAHPRPSQPQASEAPAQPRMAPESIQPATGEAKAGAPSGDDRLLSAMTDSAVSHAFNMLAHTVFSQNAMTLEDLVKEMLRPLLKDWLDDNLPTLVERLVRAEIERVARGGSRR